MSDRPGTGCLILACGNPLRGDDGVGPELAARAAERFAADPAVRILAGLQWTPELAGEIRAARSVLFVDASVSSPPGELDVRAVTPEDPRAGATTHDLQAAQLLGLAAELYGASPLSALQLTVGAASIEFGEGFSEPVRAALPAAGELLARTVVRLLAAAPADPAAAL